MSSGRRVGWLAQKAGLRPEEAILRLQEAGIRVGYPHEQVSQKDLSRVRVLLGLDAPTRERASIPITEPVAVSPSTDSTALAPPLLDVERPQVRYHQIVIGQRNDSIRYLTADVVEKVHYVLVDDFRNSGDPIDPPGCRDGRAYLESALSRPTTSLGSEMKYPTVAMAGAALLHALIHDHPFYNGNKRTAIVSLLVFLDSNGYVFSVDQEELYNYVMKLAGHSIIQQGDADSETLATARWINELSRKRRRGEKRMRYRELFAVLSDHGCTYEVRPGNKLVIHRGETRLVVGGYRNEGKYVERETLKKIRGDLELDEDHGVDSEAFYYSGSIIPQFINEYRQTLKRLAYL